MLRLLCFGWFFIFGLSGICNGQDITILPINPVPGLKDTGGSASVNLPCKFDGTGIIKTMLKNEIVIDERLFELSPYLRVSSQANRKITRSHFQEGTSVGYILDTKGRILFLVEIVED